MFDTFFPDEYVVSTYVIPFEKLYEEGYKGLVFDIDNTLVPHGAPADERAVKLFERLRKMGFSTCLISNNQEPRVRPFAEKVESKFVCNAHKPSTKKDVYKRQLVISKKGKVLGVGENENVTTILELVQDKVGSYIDKMLNERLLNILSTKENVNLETLGFSADAVKGYQAMITPINICLLYTSNLAILPSYHN